MKNQNIANFAESLLAQESEKLVESGKTVQFSAPGSSDAPDVSEVEVSPDFTHQILSEGSWKKAHVNVAPIAHRPKRVDEEAIYKKKLLERYEQKVVELEQLVTEMTTVGMLGTGPGPGATAGATSLSVTKPKKKKKKGKGTVYDRLNRINNRSY